MKRTYTPVVEEHLASYRQMVFLAGPRQVGKTTCAKTLAKKSAKSFYLNWDVTSDRRIIQQGTQSLAEHAKLNIAQTSNPLIILDEVHKLKFFDVDY